MLRTCEHCGKDFQAQSSRARFCSSSCRGRARRAKGKPTATVIRVAVDEPAREPVESVFDAVRAELVEAKALDSSAGRAALVLASMVDQATVLGGSGAAALVKELRATLSEALKSKPQAVSLVDELRNRREQRANAS